MKEGKKEGEDKKAKSENEGHEKEGKSEGRREGEVGSSVLRARHFMLAC